MANKTTDLDEARVVDLREKAKDAGLTGVSHMRKDELIEALGEHETPQRKGPARQRAQLQGGTDAIELLIADHENVKALFKQALDGDVDDAQMQQLAQQITRELTLHTEIEEQIFYPALKERALSEQSEEVKDEVLEAYVEHGSVKDLIADIESMQPTDESYKAILTVIREQVEHHVEEEEGEMFKSAREMLDASRLTEIGEQMAAYKENAAMAQT